MSEILCTCGHPINAHSTTGGETYHCWEKHGQCNTRCKCNLSPNDIVQTRIRTLREALTKIAFGEGDTPAGNFNEQNSSRIARKALTESESQ